PSSCLPRLESSGHFSGSLLVRKRELSLMEEHSPLVKSLQKGYHKEKKAKEPYLCVLTSDC
ncbi:hypothetical protein, partial [Faecalibacterium longum]